MDGIVISDDGMPHATGSYRSPLDSYIHMDRHIDARTTHSQLHRNDYIYTAADRDAGAAWLSEASGGLHTRRGQRLDH